jgi:nitrite reductase/ring-hydroxylating ferredoxin subunit
MLERRDNQGPEPPADDWVRAGTLEELKARRMTVVRGGTCPLLVVHDRGKFFALDNRCPHLGFPLHRGSIEDGILTCHWHHARFDLASGGTFDLWADDIPTSLSSSGTGLCGFAGGHATRTATPTGAIACARACSMISVLFSPRRCWASVAVARIIGRCFATVYCSVSAIVTGGVSD